MPIGENGKNKGRRDSDLDETISMASLRPVPETGFSAGRYQVIRELGEGGQKSVFLARDTRLERDVVISVLRKALGEEPARRLLREARAMARLGEHPNLVTVYDLGEEQGHPYIVTQHVDGGSLKELMKSTGEGLPLDRVVELSHQVSAALDHAHRHGVIHRDVKPSNIWLTRDGVAKLGDFGLALTLESSRLTMEGTVVGTAIYLSPEQAQGLPADSRTDLYSLGVVLYEMVTGRPPFQGDHLAGILWQHIHVDPVAPSWHNPGIPEKLETLILDLLAKQPATRHQSASDVLAALREVKSPAAAPGVSKARTRRGPSLSRLASGVFVGRDRHTLQLTTAFENACRGQGRMVLLAGEAGSGKTRMAEQLATTARMRRACVVVGQCYEGQGSPAFWPWVQVIRTYAEIKPDEALSRALGSGAAAVKELVTEIGARVPHMETLPSLEPEQARFRLFESTTNFLKNASREQPLVVVLDDLHWADPPSLRLLEFLARDIAGERILVIGTYRDADLLGDHPLRRALAELNRQGSCELLAMEPLTDVDVGRYIELSTGLTPAGSLRKAVFERTEGNPFFVQQVVKLLVSEGRLENMKEDSSLPMRIPQGVREAILRQLERLPADCNRMLSIAALAGREFRFEAVEPLCGLRGERLFDMLDAAMAAGVLTHGKGGMGTYRFHHALFRETLYEEIGSHRRAYLHAQMGTVLENMYGQEAEAHLAELAHHYLQAAPLGDPAKAMDLSMRAAERASRLLAYEDAASHYERALETMRLPGAASIKHEEGPLLLSMAEANKRAGRPDRCRQASLQAAALARTTASSELLAKAALCIGSTLMGALGRTDQEQVELLEEALRAFPPQDSVLRCRLLAQLSSALYYFTDRRLSLSLEALEMARRLGDPAALLHALYYRHVAMMLAENIEERNQVARELFSLASQLGNKELLLRAHYRFIIDFMESGDMESLDREIENYRLLAEELRQPVYLWMARFFRGSRLLLSGRFAECELLGREALELGRRVGDPTAPLFVGVQAIILRIETGNAAQHLEPLLRQIEMYPMIPGNRATLAYLYCHLNREEEARAELDRIAAKDFTDLFRDGSFIVVLSSLGYVCRHLADARRARLVYPMLLPYAGRNIMSGNSGVGIGSVERPLALLAATMKQWDLATVHFEQAIDSNSRMGAKPFLAATQLEYATMLLDRGHQDDRPKARQLLLSALAVTVELGMKSVEAQARREVERLDGTLARSASV